MPAHIIATADEIPPGGRKIVTVNGREIGVFNLGGTTTPSATSARTNRGRSAAAACAPSSSPTARPA